MDEKTPWYYSIEDHCEVCNSKNDAHSAAADYIDSQYEVGDTVVYLIGRCKHPLDTIKFPARQAGMLVFMPIVEGVSANMHADEDCFSMSFDDVDQLGKLILDFIRQKAKVDYWSCEDKERTTHTYTAGGDDD